MTGPLHQQLADAAGTNAWDIGLIGAEPQRAEKIAFTAAYCEIEATYLVPKGSALQTIADVDSAERPISVLISDRFMINSIARCRGTGHRRGTYARLPAVVDR